MHAHTNTHTHLDEYGGGYGTAGDLVHGGGVPLTGEVEMGQGHHPSLHWVQVVGESVAP